MHEYEVPAVAFLLLLLSLTQLAMSPVISGDVSCNCGWDTGSPGQTLMQGFGLAVSVGGACAALGVGGATLLRNRDPQVHILPVTMHPGS